MPRAEASCSGRLFGLQPDGSDASHKADGIFSNDLARNILDERLRHSADRYLSIDSAEGQVVDPVAERDVPAFSGVELDGQNVAARPSMCGVSSNENGVWPPRFSPSLWT